MNPPGRQAKEGDVQVFTDLRTNTSARSTGSQHITQNDEGCYDVLQEAFLKAYEHPDNFQGNSKFYT